MFDLITDDLPEVLNLSHANDRSSDAVLSEAPGYSDLSHRDTLLLSDFLYPEANIWVYFAISRECGDADLSMMSAFPAPR